MSSAERNQEGHLRNEGEGPVSRIERQLATAQALTHIGSWEWDVRTGSVTWSDELYRIYGMAPQERAITFDTFLACLHPADRERVQRDVGAAVERGTRFAYPERIVRPDGSIRYLDTVGEVVRDASGVCVRLLGTCRDVTEARAVDEQVALARRMQAAEQRVFEMIAEGSDLKTILTTLALAIEEQSPPTLATILLLDADGRLRCGAAPTVSPAFTVAIEGRPIGPRAGSCGTAAFLGEPVFVEDVESDPLWEDYRDLARAAKLRACWSTPIVDADGRVLGTFALYDRKPRVPGPEDLALIGRATHIAGLAIERRRLEDELRALSSHLESVREQERTAIAREIHDELGQALTALKMDLAWVARRVREPANVAPSAVLEKLSAMGSMTDEVIEQVRRISAALRPGVLDDLGLVAALEWQAGEFERRTGAACIVRSNVDDDAPLAREAATALFRIFQETLTNVARHGEASRVEVRFERSPPWLTLDITDDGKGIPNEAVFSPRSLGLIGIRERARSLGGAATFGRAGDRGTHVSVRLPLFEGAP